MNILSENTYWIAIAHLPRWQTERINHLIIRVIHEKNMLWEHFFSLDKEQWKNIFAFTDKELTDIEAAKNDLPRLAFIAEQLQNEGIEIIPINSPYYPTVLKENLKTKNSPPLLYIKGKKDLLKEDTTAIVGSRKAGQDALDFTDRIARKTVADKKVIVSGFAKGVDKQALDSALDAQGKSIIVLPQGILTFQAGFNKYYQYIVKGDLLVLSTFFPKAGWEVGLAMARNAYIYGLAKEIYVAESENHGGTWEGAINGLKRQRNVYVRIPEEYEKNANNKLIELGAIPVDASGNRIQTIINHDLFAQVDNFEMHEPAMPYSKKIEQQNPAESIIDLLRQDAYTITEIKMILKLDWNSRKLSAFLRKNPNIRITENKPAKYSFNKDYTPSLFDDSLSL